MPREAREVLPDYYEILGVPCDADPAAVKGAFRQRALTTHPDRPGGSDEAFRRVMQAFSVLFSERAAYDAARAAATAPAPAPEPPAKRRNAEPAPTPFLNIRSTSNLSLHAYTYGPFSAVSTPIFASKNVTRRTNITQS